MSQARKIPALLCALALLGSARAAAQQKGIETVTVTARKTEQDLQSTAEAVTAFSAEDLASWSIDEVKNLGRLTPNVRLENSPGTGTSAAVTIRGISQPDPLITGDPSVGIYVDGIYNARLVGGNFSFFAILSFMNPFA